MKRGLFLAIGILCWLCHSQLYCADKNLVLKGFLGQEVIQKAALELQDIDHSTPATLSITIQSQSGELARVMHFAKELYALKLKHKTTIAVTIDEEALGPGAIIPFLADTLYITPTATWGAIVSHSETDIPLNVLQSRLLGFIDPKQPRYELLKLIAAAMCDSEVQIISHDGLKQVFSLQEGQELITQKGDTLVLNQTQILALGLANPIQTLVEEKKPATEVINTFEEQLKRNVHFAENAPRRIGYIALNNRDEAISQSTWIFLTTALNEYKKNPPACIVLELNSPGGEVFAAERMSDALKEMDTQYGVPVVCYINNWAISAGAMLAYSCRFIVVAKDASMGAAEPIIMGGEGQPQTASEKIQSALRTDFANRAGYFGRNPNIAEAMVDKDIILVKRHSKIIKLDSEDQIRKGGIDPDVLISPKGKLLTLNAKQLLEYGVAELEVQPTKLEMISHSEREKGVWPVEKSALGQIAFFKGASIESYQMNWQTRFLAFLTSPAISSLLFMILIISIYMELSSGGFGVAGAVGLISLFLIVLSSFALEAMHWLEPILIIFGLVLLGLELFFFPTLGILGFVGSICIIVGLAGIMLPGIEHVSYDGNTLNAAGEYVLSRLAWLSAAFLAALTVIILLSRFMWPKFRLVQKIVLDDSSRSQEARLGSMHESPLTKVPDVGVLGVVVATLRPAGKIQIGDDLFDAVSTGSFLSKGTRVRVVGVEGYKVTVEESV